MCILFHFLHPFYSINIEKINKCYFNFCYFYSFKKIMKKYISIFMYAHQKLGTKCQIHANCKSHGAFKSYHKKHPIFQMQWDMLTFVW